MGHRLPTHFYARFEYFTALVTDIDRYPNIKNIVFISLIAFRRLWFDADLPAIELIDRIKGRDMKIFIMTKLRLLAF